ncbi:DsbE family thiol:disulfide interchange protein [Variovorax sp. Sphag1AA]|nr:DsbE family thiol:disulfide interchange protein [Variovorax sp. Sphag1AA]MBB3176870.1 cytochrome c biogenesis protein CcmG/thiol:disulfide interchange protein DsbE [Variovorax sp. Sphag1AA]
MTRFLLPLGVFLALAIALAAGLSRDPRALPSPLVGKPAPAFELPLLDNEARSLRSSDMQGKVWVLNVWASWCTPCQLEHPLLVDFASRTRVPVVGLNYKDQPAAARAWLQRLGNPYAATMTDLDGRTGIDFGVYGVPETFVIDRSGRVRFRHAGPMTPEVLEHTLTPLLLDLEREKDGHA